MSESSRYPFPGVIFTGKDQFEEYRASHSAVLDSRYKLEQKLLLSEEVKISGICPLMLQRTEFVTRVDASSRQPDGTVSANWRRQQVCSRGLAMGDRAVAHYALYNSPKGHLGRIFYISDRDGLSDVLRPYGDEVERGDFDTLRDSRQSYDTILIISQMEHQPDQAHVLDSVYSHLSEGGRAVMHINLHYFDVESIKREIGELIYWATGWDFLHKCAAAQFNGSHAVNFWAPEIGYLGPYNFIFCGSKPA